MGGVFVCARYIIYNICTDIHCSLLGIYSIGGGGDVLYTLVPCRVLLVPVGNTVNKLIVTRLASRHLACSNSCYLLMNIYIYIYIFNYYRTPPASRLPVLLLLLLLLFLLYNKTCLICNLNCII